MSESPSQQQNKTALFFVFQVCSTAPSGPVSQAFEVGSRDVKLSEALFQFGLSVCLSVMMILWALNTRARVSIAAVVGKEKEGGRGT